MRRRELILAMLALGLGCRRSPEPDSSRTAPRPRDEPPAGDAPPHENDDATEPLGALDDVPASLRPAFDPAAHQRPPARLANHAEPPQSYATFLAERPPRPQPGAGCLAILPIGEYPRGFVVEYERVHLVRSPEPALLGRFCEAWFGLPVRILPAMSDALLETLPAREHEGRRQVDAEAILAWLRPRLPDDCHCVLALTLEDLFGDGAAHVFGLASIKQRVGVHSMLRYDPGFANADARPPDFERTILTRALRVVAHETAHMFGLRHCIHFSCVMNPTASLADLDGLPLRACPVCLRKLWNVTGVSLTGRWEALAEFSAALDLAEEALWFEGRLAALGLPGRSQP